MDQPRCKTFEADGWKIGPLRSLDLAKQMRTHGEWTQCHYGHEQKGEAIIGLQHGVRFQVGPIRVFNANRGG